jgi:hypothetical protein
VLGSLKPAIEVHIARSICARFGNSVLSRRVQPLVEFEHDCDGVSVAGEVDGVLELIDVCLYILFALEVAIRFESHERHGCLVLWAEHRREFLSEVPP